jgi:hypothetical protein
MKKTADYLEKKSLTWWQWILMYPTLFIAISGSIPTLMNIFYSVKLDVPFDEVQIAREQNNLWNKNFECARTSPIYWSEVDDKGIKIGVTACPSKDVLVAVNGKIQPSYRWIGFNTFNQTQQMANWLTPAAIATDFPSPIHLAQSNEEYTVLCQKKLSDTRILRRVKKPNGQCFDQTIDTATGKVIKEVSVKCDSDCDRA